MATSGTTASITNPTNKYLTLAVAAIGAYFVWYHLKKK